MVYRPHVLALLTAALFAAPASAATVHTAHAAFVEIDISDSTQPPYLSFLIDTPGVEVWAHFLDSENGWWNIFPDPMLAEEMSHPEGDSIPGLEAAWETDLVLFILEADEPFQVRWIRTYFTPGFSDFEQVVHAPIPAALPMTLAALGGLALLVRRRKIVQ